MSALETTIWYILGYITMPLIFVFGFAATAIVSCFLLNFLSKGAHSKPVE